jgi:hypothetical protein
MRHLVFIAVATIAAASSLSAQAAPYRVIGGRRIVSAMQPSVTIDVDSTLAYVGSQRFELYGVALAEQHLFVDLRDTTRTRFLWVQYEEYLPSSNGRYDYSADSLVTDRGHALRTQRELWTVPRTESRPGSDGAKARELLRAHGIVLPPQMLYERMVWLPDSTRRRELMFIYAESVGSPDRSRVARLLDEHQVRALRAYTITP